MKIFQFLLAKTFGFETMWAIHEPEIGSFGEIETEYLKENTVEIWQIRAEKGAKIRIKFEFMNIALTR